MVMRRVLALMLLLLSWLPALAGAAPAAASVARPVLVLGDSLSAAHNIAEQDGWVHLLGVRLASMRPPRVVINASVSGATTADGVSRLPGLLKRYRPALVLLELGANDGLRGLPLAGIRANLQTMIHDCRQAGAKIVLLGIELPVNYGPPYRDGLQAIYADLARGHHLPLLPFLLQGVALDPALMQSDGLHPVAAGEPRVLANVWSVLEPTLKTL